MVDVAFYSLIELLTGFSTSVTMLLILRTLFGIGMGGEWGIGASLAMEKIPRKKRGAQLGEISAPERRRPAAAAPVANPASPRSP